MGPGQATEAWEARPAHPPAEAHAPRSGACRIMWLSMETIGSGAIIRNLWGCLSILTYYGISADRELVAWTLPGPVVTVLWELSLYQRCCGWWYRSKLVVWTLPGPVVTVRAIIMPTFLSVAVSKRARCAVILPGPVVTVRTESHYDANYVVSGGIAGSKKPSLFQILAWRRIGTNAFSEPMMT